MGPAQRGPPGCRREEWTLGGGWVAPGTETQLAGTLVSFPSHSPPAPLGFLFFFNDELEVGFTYWPARRPV